MKLDWIDDLLAIADTGSLSAAANKRHLSQPAFSRRVRTIELALGTQLIDRERKPVRLTASVVELEPRLREASRIMHALKHDLHRIDQQQSELVVVSQHAISTAIAPRLIKEVTSHHNVRVRLRSANREECYSLLFSGQADIGLFYQTEDEQPVESAQFVDTVQLSSEPLVPVIAQHQQTQFNEEYEKGIIRAIAYPPGVFLGGVLSHSIQPQLDTNISMQWITETALTTAALQAAIIGVGLAWVPLSLAKDAIKRGEVIRLDPTLPSVSMMVVAMRSGLRSHSALDESWLLLSSR